MIHGGFHTRTSLPLRRNGQTTNGGRDVGRGGENADDDEH